MTTRLIALAVLAACGSPDAPPPEAPAEAAAPEPAGLTLAGGPQEAPAEAKVGGDPMGAAPSPVSRVEADAIWAAVSAALQGKEPVQELLRVDGKEVALSHWEDPRLIISETCAPGGVLGACLALDAVRDMPTKHVPIGAGNPASHYCPAAGGEPVRAVTESGGESGLCKFADGSMISEWSLVYVPDFGRKATAPN